MKREIDVQAGGYAICGIGSSRRASFDELGLVLRHIAVSVRP
jgi:hypothetical protein